MRGSFGSYWGSLGFAYSFPAYFVHFVTFIYMKSRGTHFHTQWVGKKYQALLYQARVLSGLPTLPQKANQAKKANQGTRSENLQKQAM